MERRLRRRGLSSVHAIYLGLLLLSLTLESAFHPPLRLPVSIQPDGIELVEQSAGHRRLARDAHEPQRCVDHQVVGTVAQCLDNLRKLSGILLDAGSNDDYNLHWGHRLLSHHLSRAGIAHEHRENPGNHGGRANERYQVALEWLSQVVDRE